MTSKCWFLLWNKRYFIHSFSDSHYLIRTCFSYPAALFSPFENGVPKCLKNAEIYHRITVQKFQKFTVSLIYYFGDIKGWKMILYNPGQVMACFFFKHERTSAVVHGWNCKFFNFYRSFSSRFLFERIIFVWIFSQTQILSYLACIPVN